jgi:hypothetical protein
VFVKLINYLQVNIILSKNFPIPSHFLVASNMFMPKLFDQTPPSYLKWARLFLSKSDNCSQLSPFPYIASVTNRIVLCTKVKKKTKSIYSSKKKSFSFLRLIYIPECQMYIWIIYVI